MSPPRAFFLATVIFLVATCGSRIQAQKTATERSKSDNSQLRKAVGSMVLTAKEAIDKSQQALGEIDRLRSRETVPLQAALPSAEAAFLLGAPSQAITIMERVVREYPAEKVPGVRFSVGMVGNLWIGTFARYSGDMTRAEAAYRDILTQLKTQPNIELPSMLASICYLYLAEIENHFRNRPQKAAAILEELRALPFPKEQEPARILAVYKQWGQHMSNSLERPTAGSTPAAVRAQPPYGDSSYVPILQIAIVGLGDLGDLGAIAGPARSRSNTDFCKCSLEKALLSRASPIDTSLAQLLIGESYLRKDDAVAARAYYKDLFESKSFLAPEGGLGLARCWKKDNKPDEARSTLQELIRRFPAYKDLATQLLLEWSDKSKTR